MRHPVQNVKIDDHGTPRFQQNIIVDYLLRKGPFDLNHLALQDFPREDYVQFAQLIGYSVSGFGGLGYVSDDDYYIAEAMIEGDLTEEQAELQYLRKLVSNLRSQLRPVASELFGVAEEDLLE